MRTCVFGAGYVGIVAAAGFAHLGHTVALYDTDTARIATLRSGALPLYEPGLLAAVEASLATGRLRFCDDPDDALRACASACIAVGTPAGPDGADVSRIRAAAASIVAAAPSDCVIVLKSTAPAGTLDMLSAAYPARVFATCPEFLREGSAVHDFAHPDRIVIGSAEPHGIAVTRELYAGLDAPVIVVSPRAAELIKYASNAFLALKVSFANEIAAIAAAYGVDATAVLAATAADERIGSAHLGPGLGFGGSCLPKDLDELRRSARTAGVTSALLDAVAVVNAQQIEHVAAGIDRTLGGLAGRRIGVLGLAFKPETDDVRDAPALALIEVLLRAGASVCVHDPAALANARAVLGDRVAYAPARDHSAAANGADALVIATEWPVYRALDFAQLRAIMRRPVLIDARNVYAPAAVTQAGFHYAGIGRNSCES